MPTAADTIQAADPADRSTSLAAAASEFGRLRPRLLGIAYRILGTWTEAEDIVQDAWLRWQTCDRGVVESPTAYLVTTTSRLAINAAQSARVRRESYVHRWVHEPVDTSPDPAVRAERRDDLEHGLRALRQRLSPTERAAYVMRRAFDLPYPAIAEALRVSEANARQLVSRGGKHLSADRRALVALAP